MKIIFLDIDGVLNSSAYLKASGGRHFNDGTGHLNPKNIAHLNRIIEETGAVVVVSSTWRRIMELDELQKVLEKKGFIGKIIGMTPTHLSGGYGPRAKEIKYWLDDYRQAQLEHEDESLESWVAVDDDTDISCFRANAVLTDFYGDGLTAELADQAIAILNR